MLFLLQIDEDGSGSIVFDELDRALQVCGVKLPQYKIRNIIDEFDKNRDNQLSMEEFTNVSHCCSTCIS